MQSKKIKEYEYQNASLEKKSNQTESKKLEMSRSVFLQGDQNNQLNNMKRKNESLKKENELLRKELNALKNLDKSGQNNVSRDNVEITNLKTENMELKIKVKQIEMSGGKSGVNNDKLNELMREVDKLTNENAGLKQEMINSHNGKCLWSNIKNRYK